MMFKWKSRSYANVSGLQIVLIIELLGTSQHLEKGDNYKHIMHFIRESYIYLSSVYMSICHKHVTIVSSCYIIWHPKIKIDKDPH